MGREGEGGVCESRRDNQRGEGEGGRRKGESLHEGKGEQDNGHVECMCVYVRVCVCM